MFLYFSNKIYDLFILISSYLLKTGGHIPKKIAIIMDGNRRFAEKKHMKKIDGHKNGSETLLNLVQWSKKFSVQEITAFAFSIDNFKRSNEEKDSLLNLFKEYFYKFCESNEAKSLGIKICIYGNRNFFDEEIKNIFKKIEEKTKNNNLIKLNVCIGYNSNEEIYLAKKLCKNIEKNFNDINFLKNKFESNLYGGYNCNPDLLIRTSGETRLSNFLLYQCRFSVIIFIDKFWPELTFLDYFKILLKYNYNYVEHQKKMFYLEKENNFKIIDNNII